MANLQNLNDTNRRFTALDIFRGLTIVLMILVNTSGDESVGFGFLNHADWNGFTLADLVFPSFLFAVGNSIAFASRNWDKEPQSAVMLKIAKRTGLLFLIGYVIQWFPFFTFDADSHLIFSSISGTRIMGVLQRIALCYGVVACLVYYLDRHKVLYTGIALLALYWTLLVWFGSPGNEYTKTGNAVLRFDNFLLGTNHLYTGEGFPFDPEGVLSTIPALFNAIAGYIVANLITRKGMTSKTVVEITIAGIGLLIIALAWSRFFPINKKLWTSSFAMLTVAIDSLVLTFIIYCREFLHLKKGFAFLHPFGKNPLAIYILSEIGVNLLWFIPVNGEPLYALIYSNIFSHLGGDATGSFLFSLWWVLICWLAAHWLDRKKIYIKI